LRGPMWKWTCLSASALSGFINWCVCACACAAAAAAGQGTGREHRCGLGWRGPCRDQCGGDPMTIRRGHGGAHCPRFWHPLSSAHSRVAWPRVRAEQVVVEEMGVLLAVAGEQLVVRRLDDLAPASVSPGACPPLLPDASACVQPAPSPVWSPAVLPCRVGARTSCMVTWCGVWWVGRGRSGGVAGRQSPRLPRRPARARPCPPVRVR